MTDHKPFTDDGVTYCGWATDSGIVDGCGETWPCSAVRTQAAGEHHTGTLNLAGEGNEAEGDPPIDLEILTAAWAATTGCGIDQIRAALVAALPALRRQIAEEIAVALDERHRSNLALSGGDKDYIPRDGRVGLATGYQRAAGIAREIGAR